MTYFRTKWFNIRIGGRFKLVSGGGPFTKLDNRRYEKEPGTRVVMTDRSTAVIEWPPQGADI